jgi:DNA mismatch repair protein MSH6
MPSAKSKPQEKDQKKQKSLLGWLAKPEAAKAASSSSAANAPVTVTSSSPSGRDSIFETPSTKRRTTLGSEYPAVGSATFTKSSDGGRSINETPPTSDPIDVDISSDEDLPSRDIKSVCGSSICAL